jgi:hypothetical protein
VPFRLRAEGGIAKGRDAKESLVGARSAEKTAALHECGPPNTPIPQVLALDATVAHQLLLLEGQEPREASVQVEAYRVLEAVAWVERHLPSPTPPLPLKRIAVGVLRGDERRAERVLAQLDLDGLLQTDTMGWRSGGLTSKGHTVVATEAG